MINKFQDEILLGKFVDYCKWIKEACENVRNANEYWATKRYE